MDFPVPQFTNNIFPFSTVQYGALSVKGATLSVKGAAPSVKGAALSVKGAKVRDSEKNLKRLKTPH